MNKPQFNLNHYDPKTIIVMNIPILRKININALNTLNDKISGISENSNNFYNVNDEATESDINILKNLSGFFHFIEPTFTTKNSPGLLSLSVKNKNNFSSYINTIIENIVELNPRPENRFFSQSLRTAQSLKGDLITSISNDNNSSFFNPVPCDIYSTGNNKNSLFCRAKTTDSKVKDVYLLTTEEETRNWVVRYRDDIFYTDTIVLHFTESPGLNVKNSAIYFYFSLLYILQNMIIDCIKQLNSPLLLSTISESRTSEIRDVYYVNNKIYNIISILHEFCSVFKMQLNIKEKTIKHIIDDKPKNDIICL